MKKIILAIIALILAAGAIYFTANLPAKTDQTKTEAETGLEPLPALSEDSSLSTIESELDATELEDFDQEFNDLDKSINQL